MLLALTVFWTAITGTHILVQSDNTTVVAYLMKQRGCHSPTLMVVSTNGPYLYTKDASPLDYDVCTQQLAQCMADTAACIANTRGSCVILKTGC